MVANTKKQKILVPPLNAAEVSEDDSKQLKDHYRMVLMEPVPKRLSALIKRLKIVDQTKG